MAARDEDWPLVLPDPAAAGRRVHEDHGRASAAAVGEPQVHAWQICQTFTGAGRRLPGQRRAEDEDEPDHEYRPECSSRVDGHTGH